MSTSTFDRPLVLTKKGVDRLIELNKEWEKNPPRGKINPVPVADKNETEQLMEKVWENYQQSRKV